MASETRDQVGSYLIEILSRSESAQRRCTTLLSQDYISSPPRDLAATISAVCSYLSQASLAIFHQIDWTDRASQDRDLLSLRIADQLVQQIAAHLRYIQGSRVDRLPWSIVPSFEDLAARLDPDAIMMLRPKWNYNYTVTLSDLREQYRSSLQEFADYLPGISIDKIVLGSMPKAFHIVSFPALERENILLHTLLGHELGHRFADRFLTQDREIQFALSVQDEIDNLTRAQLRTKAGNQPGSDHLFAEEERRLRQAENTNLAIAYWKRASEEVLSDLVGAILFGPAALFSTLELAMQQGYDTPPTPGTSYYPPWRTRLRMVLQHLQENDPDCLHIDQALFTSDDARLRADYMNRAIRFIETICSDRPDLHAAGFSPVARIAYSRLPATVSDGAKHLLAVSSLRREGRKSRWKVLCKRIPKLIERLDHDLPPNAVAEGSERLEAGSLVDIINAAWFHRVSLGLPPCHFESGDPSKLTASRLRTNRLTLKAIESASLSERYKTRSVTPASEMPVVPEVASGDASVQGCLSGNEVLTCLGRSKTAERLVITPLLEPTEAVGSSSVDVRLGNQFIVMRRESFPLLDVGKAAEFNLDIERYQERIIKPFGQPFVLHPRQLVIGSTFEYVSLPLDLMCYVIGKSTWGRMGLIIATATKVDPGFKGCITLEIINEGEVPIVLYPGLPIAQLVFHWSRGGLPYSGQYSCAIGPEFPKFSASMQQWSRWTRK